MSVSAGADRVFVMSELPRNVMGKVQKAILRHEHRGLF